MKRKLRIANKRRFITVISALIFVLGVIISSAAMMMVASADAPVIWQEIMVNEGDTLWAIAEKSSSESEDIRLKIHAIIEENNLRGAIIFPGETLRVPVSVPYSEDSLQAVNY